MLIDTRSVLVAMMTTAVAFFVGCTASSAATDDVEETGDLADDKDDTSPPADGVGTTSQALLSASGTGNLRNAGTGLCVTTNGVAVWNEACNRANPWQQFTSSFREVEISAGVFMRQRRIVHVLTGNRIAPLAGRLSVVGPDRDWKYYSVVERSLSIPGAGHACVGANLNMYPCTYVPNQRFQILR